jgi:predicted ATPase/class 3 adenylate cyclase
MFCDLVGSTPLSEQLDPEELQEVLHLYQETGSEVIRRFEGCLARCFGDGLLVYFGYPLAHEDDARRAIRAGLGIIEEIRKLNKRLEKEKGIKLAVRLGIHTGLAVVGEMGGGDTREPLAIVGDTPNIAARLQGLAEPNTIVISNITHKLIQGFFTCRSMGTHFLKGISQPMPLYQVLQESGAQSRLDVAVFSELTPLVGREKEVAFLRHQWEQIKKGEPQVVLLKGDGGIGKSRLVQVMKQHVVEESHRRSDFDLQIVDLKSTILTLRSGIHWLECRCSPHYQNSALHPIIDLLQRALSFTPEDPPEEKLSKLEEVLEAYDFFLPEEVSLFASLLSLPLPDHYPSIQMAPQKQKEKTLDALATLLLKMVEIQPLLFIVEDLHWVDPSTLQWVHHLIERIAEKSQNSTARILILLTARSEFELPWNGEGRSVSPSFVSQIQLNRLDHDQMKALVERITRGKALPDEVLNQLLAKTDGVPLFIEEFTRMILESGWLQERENCYELIGLLPPLAIPATLQESLAARLDHLRDVKELAQLGATLGRTFTYELLRAVSFREEGSLQKDLSRLVQAELLYQLGIPPQARYIFKHALIQEAAYQSLLKSKRQHYHHQIARVLEEQFPETVETQPELLAHHYTEAGLHKEAIVYWHWAGQQAIQRSAHVEAISHLTRGLELLKALPDVPENCEQELLLQTTLGPALMATKGFAAPEVQKVYARARELCLQMGKTTAERPIASTFTVLRGLWVFYVMRAELQTAQELGEQLLRIAQTIQDPALLLEAHRTLGETLFYLGELDSARTHLEHGITFYESQKYDFHAFLYGQDSRVTGLSCLAWTLWHLGYPDQALRRSEEALGLAHKISHPFSLAYALNYAALLHQLRGERQMALEHAEKAINLSTEQGFAHWSAVGIILRGWVLNVESMRGLEVDRNSPEHSARHSKSDFAQINQGLIALRLMGAELDRPYFLALQAEVYIEARQFEEGLSILTEATTIAQKSRDRWWEAELYRLRGELSIKMGKGYDEGEAYFRQAFNIACRQRTKSLELRTAISLSRLLQKRGEKEEARHLLKETYGWFTEGFDTADLKEAKQLLEIVRQPS